MKLYRACYIMPRLKYISVWCNLGDEDFIDEQIVAEDKGYTDFNELPQRDKQQHQKAGMSGVMKQKMILNYNKKYLLSDFQH